MIVSTMSLLMNRNNNKILLKQFPLRKYLTVFTLQNVFSQYLIFNYENEKFFHTF